MVLLRKSLKSNKDWKDEAQLFTNSTHEQTDIDKNTDIIASAFSYNRNIEDAEKSWSHSVYKYDRSGSSHYSASSIYLLLQYISSDTSDNIHIDLPH